MNIPTSDELRNTMQVVNCGREAEVLELAENLATLIFNDHIQPAANLGHTEVTVRLSDDQIKFYGTLLGRVGDALISIFKDLGYSAAVNITRPRYQYDTGLATVTARIYVSW